MEQKKRGFLFTLLAILTVVGVLAFVVVRMEKELGALRYRIEQWMCLRQKPLTVDLTEE